MEPEDHPMHDTLGKLPDPPEPAHWWLVTPSPMQFENIGFSRPVSAQGSSGELLQVAAMHSSFLFRKSTEAAGVR